MKKKICAACLGVSILMTGICGCNAGEVKEIEATAAEETNPETEETEVIQETTQEVSETQNKEHGEIISISMAEMKEKLAAKEDFLVSFVTINCPYCQEFHEILVDYIQEHVITMYQVILDYEDLPEEENRRIIKEYFNEFSTVPGTFYVENGENASYLDMYNLGVSREVLDHWVQELGIEEK